MRVLPEQALGLIPHLNQICDEPFADGSPIPTLLIARFARKSVKVALTGDGGDELFGGYTRYSWHDTLWRTLMQMPKPARQCALRLTCCLSGEVWETLRRALSPITPTVLRQRNPGENLERLRAILRSGRCIRSTES